MVGRNQGDAENLCICGPSGTGKSHLAEALGHLAIDRGKTVAWHTLENLAALLRRHRADDTVNRAVGRLIRADLIVIDDIGMLQSPPTPPRRCFGSSTPPTKNAQSRSPATSTRPASTS